MGEWTRIGRGSLPRLALIIALIALGIALFIAAPVAQLGTLVLGVAVPFWLGYLAGAVVVFILIAPLLLPRATRPLSVDASRTRMRVAGRTFPSSDVRHAYRLPDPQFDGRFQLQLAVPGIDPLVGVSTASPAELSVDELGALLQLIENSPIELDPGVIPRPPLGDELGVRDDAERFDDDLAATLLAFERMSFPKPTLIAELRRIRDSPYGAPVGRSASTVRDLGLVAPGTTNAPERRRLLGALPPQAGPSRGFWALLGSAHRSRLAEVESWLRSFGVPVASSRGWHWSLGLALIVLGLASPWLSGAIAVPALFASGGTGAFASLMGVVVFFVLTWPFIVWPGIVLMWRARISRYETARSGVLAVRRQRVAVPGEIGSFFGPPFPEVAFLNSLVWLVVVESIVLLAGGLTSIAIGVGQVENWEALPLGVPVGVLMVLASAPVFAWGVRIIRDGPVRQVRADAFWNAITS